MSINVKRWDVLVTNKGWLVLGTTTIKKAIISLFSEGMDNNLAAKAFDIQYEYLGDNKWNFDNPISIKPVNIEEWLKLEILPYHSFISTAKQKIRIPSVIMAQNCDKTHLRRIVLNTKNILERDNYTCQYTGKKLSRSELNIDHVISRDEWKRRGLAGSPDNWKNMVASDKKINFKKSNLSLKDAGLKLIREPREPLPIPASALVREIRNRDWSLFLHK